MGRKINEFRLVFTKLFALRLLLIHKSKQREEFIRFRSLIPALSPLSLAGPFPLRARQLSTFFSSPLPWNRPDLFLVEYRQVARFQPANGQRGREWEKDSESEAKQNSEWNRSLHYTRFSLSLLLFLFHFLPSRSLSLSLAPSCSRHSNTEHEPASALFFRWRSIDESSFPRFFPAPLLSLSLFLVRENCSLFLTFNRFPPHTWPTYITLVTFRTRRYPLVSTTDNFPLFFPEGKNALG